jgi:hypothetical protein
MVPRNLIVIAVAVTVSLATVACGGRRVRADGQQPATPLEISVPHASPASHRFGRVSLIPSNAPNWLVVRAHQMARALHDPRPDRVRIGLGRTYVIEMWGAFVCDLCSRPSGAKVQRGTHAWTRIAPRTHRDIGFWLTHR